MRVWKTIIIVIIGMITWVCQKNNVSTFPLEYLESNLERYTYVYDKKIVSEKVPTIIIYGMQHYSTSQSREGRIVSKKQNPTLAWDQADMFKLLYELTKKSSHIIVVGEGLFTQGKEFTLDFKKKGYNEAEWERDRVLLAHNDSFRKKFFGVNFKELGYTSFEIFFPERCRTYGIEDKTKIEKIDQLKQEEFQMALKYIPHKRDLNNPIKVKQHSTAIRPIFFQIEKINYERSMQQIETAIKHAKDNKNLTILIVGDKHREEIQDMFHGRYITSFSNKKIQFIDNYNYYFVSTLHIALEKDKDNL